MSSSGCKTTSRRRRRRTDAAPIPAPVYEYVPAMHMQHLGRFGARPGPKAALWPVYDVVHV